MSDHVYKKIELVGTSAKSVEDAIDNAIKSATDSLKYVHWFEVTEVRGEVRDGKVGYYQVGLKAGFRLDSD